MTRAAIVLRSAMMCAALLLAPGAVWAHADHGSGPAADGVIAPRVEARIGQMELVAIFAKPVFAVFLTQYADGTPVRGAAIEASTDLQSGRLTETDPGVYSSTALLFADGANAITLKLGTGSVSQTASITLDLPVEQAHGAAARTGFLTMGTLALGAVLVLVIVLAIGFTKLRWRLPSRILTRVDPHAWRA